jgi:hypothetical protein
LDASLELYRYTSLLVISQVTNFGYTNASWWIIYMRIVAVDVRRYEQVLLIYLSIEWFVLDLQTCLGEGDLTLLLDVLPFVCLSLYMSSVLTVAVGYWQATYVLLFD